MLKAAQAQYISHRKKPITMALESNGDTGGESIASVGGRLKEVGFSSCVSDTSGNESLACERRAAPNTNR